PLQASANITEKSSKSTICPAVSIVIRRNFTYRFHSCKPFIYIDLLDARKILHLVIVVLSCPRLESPQANERALLLLACPFHCGHARFVLLVDRDSRSPKAA